MKVFVQMNNFVSFQFMVKRYTSDRIGAYDLELVNIEEPVSNNKIFCYYNSSFKDQIRDENMVNDYFTDEFKMS